MEKYKRMPALFIGHGSPMNAIEDNVYSRTWKEIAEEFPKPNAILAISAHWYTNGTKINDQPEPEMVYDMYGFPEELYKVKYNPQGAPELAHITKSMISRDVKIDNSWGYDHGTWSVLCNMYPDADIPVYQLSIDRNEAPEIHLQIGREISSLRDQGVLILGSGNVVHNLSRVNWNMQVGYPWADEFDSYVNDKIQTGKFEDIINYRRAGSCADLAFTIPDHFYPLLYVLGAVKDGDKLSIYNNSRTLGSLSMTSYLFE